MNYRKKRKAAMGFYICTGICLVAIGVAALVSYTSVQNTPIKYEELSSETTNETKLPEKVKTETSKTNNDANKVTAEEIKPTPINKEDEEKDSDDESEKEDEEITQEEVNVAAEITPAPSVTEHFVFPAKANVIKGFSGGAPIYSETMRDFRVHNATDYEGDLGMNISAICDGEVTNIVTDEMYGKTVVIKHGTYLAKYSGFETVGVSIGDSVKIGEEIGTLGEIPCEIADAPHLHLEIYENGETINAESLIPK